MQDGFLHAVALRRGESPMPTFGHPEVYIRASLCLLFRVSIFPRLCLVITFVSKHFPPLFKEMRLTVAGMEVT